ncbi:hypothetical protein E2C01_002416 [Portunus trituberculatus]|uniref:Uncharacterized protein n=1 Tax=Portunus trituberculatus TaxID=210409 RepID=A0A5B7CL35_PORTR|nr:hypothetical protein [Portunus trituberculatus]
MPVVPSIHVRITDCILDSIPPPNHRDHSVAQRAKLVLKVLRNLVKAALTLPKAPSIHSGSQHGDHSHSAQHCPNEVIPPALLVSRFPLHRSFTQTT